MKFYGNLTNRLEEGRNFKENKLIEVGDDITMYSWSDRNCYYITKVISDKNIFVKRYYVCADHSKAGGMGHQDWLYFKTLKEQQDYLRTYFPDTPEVEDTDTEREWAFRNGKWKLVCRYTPDDVAKEIEELKEFDKEVGNTHTEEEYVDKAIRRFTSTKSNYDKLKLGKPIVTYHELSGKVSFGVRDYYYDWEF